MPQLVVEDRNLPGPERWRVNKSINAEPQPHLVLERGGECLPEPENTGELTQHWGGDLRQSWRSPRLCLLGLAATLAGEMMKGTLSLFLLAFCLAGGWG